MYLDCYHYGALLGDEFPVNSYGPATLFDLIILKNKLKGFDRMEIVDKSKGTSPLPKDCWEVKNES